MPLIINVSTGEVIDRDPTPEEVQRELLERESVYASRLALDAAEQERIEAKASAQTKLAALGLTESEISALLGA